MPPAAPLFPQGMCADRNESKAKGHKRLAASESVPIHRKLRRVPAELKCSPDSNDMKPRSLETCEEEDYETPKRKRAKGKGKAKGKSGRQSKIDGLDGDGNIDLSGDEQDDSEEIDFVDFSSDDDSSSGTAEDQIPAALQRKKKFYIVQNDGRPAELYRTDLIHRLRNGDDTSEDSDDDSGPSNGLLRLTDRWREEWNHGVQVPMNARNLPVFESAPNDSDVGTIEKKPFSMPSKYIGMKPEGSSAATSSTHSYAPLPNRLLYQGDRMDEIWLDHINRSRIAIGQSAISMTNFLTIMNTLEIQCYERIHQLLLAPLHSPDARVDEVDEEAACDICRSSDSEQDDAMVFCDGCNMCVHMSCYGLPELPKDEWICMKCALCYGANPPCLLCPTTGGALKCTKKMEDNKRRWAHVVCALWIPECRFGDAELREGITSIDEIPDERWQFKCGICDTRQGACIQCTVPSCRAAFHVTCALRSGLEMRIEQDPDPEVDTVRFISLCSRHRSAEPYDDMDMDAAVVQPVSASDEEVEVKENDELQRLENTFYLSVDYETISKQLKLNLLMVSDVYEYWKLKRSKRGGKPLLRNPQDEIKLDAMTKVPILSLPSPGARMRAEQQESSVYSKTSQHAERLRLSLDLGRNLLDVVQRRERERDRLVRTDWLVLRNIWEQCLMPVPLSQRMAGQLSDTLESIMTSCDITECNEREDELLMPPSRATSSVPDRESESAASSVIQPPQTTTVSRRLRNSVVDASPSKALTTATASSDSVSPLKRRVAVNSKNVKVELEADPVAEQPTPRKLRKRNSTAHEDVSVHSSVKLLPHIKREVMSPGPDEDSEAPDMVDRKVARMQSIENVPRMRLGSSSRTGRSLRRTTMDGVGRLDDAKSAKLVAATIKSEPVELAVAKKRKRVSGSPSKQLRALPGGRFKAPKAVPRRSDRLSL